MTGWTAIVFVFLGFCLGLFLLNEVYEFIANKFFRESDED